MRNPLRLSAIVLAAILVTATTLPAAIYNATFPGAAHAGGGYGTIWLTDLQLANPAAAAATAKVIFEPAAGGQALSKNYTVPARGSLMLVDVVALLGGTGGGKLRVEADQFLIGGDRTYNSTPTGTYGQYIGPVVPNKGPVWLTAMRGGKYRTNLGLLSAAGAANALTIRIPSTVPRAEGLGAFEFKQLGGVEGWSGFTAAGTSGFVEGSAEFLAYASIIDNATGDPTYYPGLPLLTEGVLPGISHATGASSTIWRSDVYFFAPSAAKLTATFVAAGTNGTTAKPQLSVSMRAGETLVYEDFMTKLKLGDGAGVIWFASTAPVLAVARTYNASSAGTYGQSILPVPPEEYVPAGAYGTFLFAAKSANAATGSRANLAIVNPTAATQTYQAELVDGTGAARGSCPVTVEPRTMRQVNDIVGTIGIGAIDNAVIRVKGSAPFTGYLSSIDNRTGDASTVPPAVQAFERVATVTVGTAGGSVSAPGVKIDVPAGALAGNAVISVFRSKAPTSFDKYRRTDVFGIDGLPDTFAKPIAVTLDVTRDGPATGKPFVVVEDALFAPTVAGLAAAPEVLSATQSGTKIATSINPTIGPAGDRELVAQREFEPAASTGETRPVFTIWAITGWYELASPSGKFTVRYPAADLVVGGAEAMAKALDDAYVSLAGLGLEWSRRTRWPIFAQLAPFPAELNTRLAQEEPSRLGVNYHWINMNANRLGSTADIPAMRGAAAHELMHLMQFLYDPRNRVTAARNPGPWYWFDEASAIWFESYFSGTLGSAPAVAKQHANFVQRALEYPPGDPDLVQDHGYGASLFLRHLASAKTPQFIGDVVKAKADASLSPVGALEQKTTLGTGSQWTLFAENYAGGRLASGWPAASEVVGLSSGNGFTFAAAADDKGYRYAFDMGDLSVWAGYALLRNASWAANTKMSIKFSDGGGNARLLIYKSLGGSITLLKSQSGSGLVTLTGVEAFVKEGSNLFFWVINGRASRPYTGTAPMAIEVSVPAPSPYEPFPSGAYEMRTGTIGGCAQYSMGDWLLTNSEGTVALQYGRAVQNVTVEGGGTVENNPAYTKPTDPKYVWAVTWKYHYEAKLDGGVMDVIDASGTFDGSKLKGSFSRDACKIDFEGVNALLVKK